MGKKSRIKALTKFNTMYTTDYSWGINKKALNSMN